MRVIPENTVCRVHVFMWSFGALGTTAGHTYPPGPRQLSNKPELRLTWGLYLGWGVVEAGVAVGATITNSQYCYLYPGEYARLAE